MPSTDASTENSAVYQLEVVIDTIHHLLDLDDLNDALDLIVKGIVRVLDDKASAAITLLGPDGRLDPSTYRVAGTLASLMQSKLPRAENGIGAWVVRQNRPVFESRVTRGESPHHPAIRQDVFSVGAYACLPMRGESRVVGTLFVLFTDAFQFTPQTRRSLTAFATLAGKATENIRIQQEKKLRQDEREQLLREIIDDSAVPMFVIDQKHRVTHWNRACEKLTPYSERTMKRINAPWQAFYDQPTPVLADLIVDGKSVEEIRGIYQERGMTFRESASKKGAFEVEGYFPKLGGRWLLFTAAALNGSDNRVIGAVETLQDMTVQKRAQEMQQRLKVADIVNEVVQVMSIELNADRLLDTIVEQIRKQLPCTYCTYFHKETQDGVEILSPRSFSDFQGTKPKSFKKGEGVAGWVYEHEESALIPDVRTDKRFVPGQDKLDTPRSMLAVPVRQGDQVIGVICADQDVKGWFDESHQRLVEALAWHAGIAIQRATALDLLRNVGKRIVATQKLEEVLERIVIGAIELTNTSSGIIHLLSKDGQAIEHSVAWPPEFGHPESRLARAKGLTLEIIAKGEVLPIPDIRRDPRVNPALRKHGVRSMIGIPLGQADRRMGVLFLNDQNPHEFTETERTLLQALADQAVIAIENARLYRSMEALKDLGEAIATVEKDRGLHIEL